MDMSSMDMSSSSMGGMHSGSSSSSCQVSMLWNWNTIDACFISESWHVTSRAMFAGSCIGVVLLVMLLEFLRRSAKEYDAYLVRKHSADGGPLSTVQSAVEDQANHSGVSKTLTPTTSRAVAASGRFRPNVLEQAIRALLHVAQFAVAYFVMLLAMYYNGYIIICIFIGAYLGSFIFHWEHMGSINKTPNTSATNQATVCCG